MTDAYFTETGVHSLFSVFPLPCFCCGCCHPAGQPSQGSGICGSSKQGCWCPCIPNYFWLLLGRASTKKKEEHTLPLQDAYESINKLCTTYPFKIPMDVMTKVCYPNSFKKFMFMFNPTKAVRTTKRSISPTVVTDSV